MAPFRKGEGGRLKGSRNKFHKEFIEALAKDFEEHGASVIRIVRAEEPATYLKIMASVMPKELQITESEFADLSDAEVAEILAFIRGMKAEPDEGEPRVH